MSSREVQAPATYSQWGYQKWNDHLLEWFFGADGSGAEPVTHLFVTDDVLRDATDAPSGEAARDALLQVFRREHVGRSFSSAASDNGDWTEDAWETPPFFLHLVVSCLVASDDNGDEAYSRRFDDACGNGMANSPDALPDLWEQLQKWLSKQIARDRAYRPLVLPRRRGWRRIGYSIDLAFPRRRDRDALRSVLADAGLIGSEPRVGLVLAALDRRLSEFSTGFKDVLRDFADARRAGDARWDHTFWLAVRDACHRRLQPRDSTGLAVRMLASISDLVLLPYLLVRDPSDAKRLGCDATEFDLIEPPWRWAIRSMPTAGIGDYDAPVVRLLRGELPSCVLSAVALQGALMFSPTVGDAFELVDGDDDEARYALVREDALERVKASLRPVDGLATISQSKWILDDWFQLADFRSKGDRATSKDILVPPSISIHRGSGMPVTDGWLGLAASLPTVVASAATKVQLRPAGDPSAAIELAKGDDGTWSLPHRDLAGEYFIDAFFDGPVERASVSIRFYTSTSHDSFKVPSASQLARYTREGDVADVGQLDPDLRGFAAAGVPDTDLTDYLYDSYFLGPIVGQISRTWRPEFPWKVRRGLNGLPTVSLNARTVPVESVATNKSAVRAWCKVFNAAPPAQPVDLWKQYKNSVKKHANSDKKRATFSRVNVETELPPQLEEPPSPVEPDEALSSLTTALAAYSARRAGIPEQELFRLFDAFVFAKARMAWSVRWDVLRSWAEAGLLELAIDTRWNGRAFFVRRPRLVLHNIGREVRGTLVGLAQPSALERLRRHVEDAKLDASVRGSRCPWVPQSVVLVASDERPLQKLAAALDFEACEWLPSLTDLCVTVAMASSTARVRPDYPRSQWWDWASCRFCDRQSLRDGVAIELLSASNQPDCYVVWNDGGPIWWSYARAWAFLRAMCLLRTPLFRGSGATITRRDRAGVYLPLAIGRYLTVVGPLIPGPSGAADSQYTYTAPTAQLGRSLVELLFSSEVVDRIYGGG